MRIRLTPPQGSPLSVRNGSTGKFFSTRDKISSALAFHTFDQSATFLLNGFSVVLRDVSIPIGSGDFLDLFFFRDKQISILRIFPTAGIGEGLVCGEHLHCLNK